MSGLFDLEGFESKSDDDLMNMSIDSFEEDVELSDEEFETMLEATRYASEFAKAWDKYIVTYNNCHKNIKKLLDTLKGGASSERKAKVEELINKQKDEIDKERNKLKKLYGKEMMMLDDGGYTPRKDSPMMQLRTMIDKNEDPSEWKPVSQIASDKAKNNAKHGYSPKLNNNVETFFAHGNKPRKDDAIGDRKPGAYKMNESTEFAPDSNATNDVDNGETDAKISVPSKTELDSNTYNDALSKLKASFKESIDVISMLENVTINDNNAILESVISDAIYESAMDGAIYESVKKDDKDDIKKICKKLTDPFKKYIKGLKLEYTEPKELTKILIGILTNVYSPNFHWWNNRLWQMVGLISCEEANIKSIIDKFNEEHSDELGEYKLIYTKTHSIRLWLQTKLNWKNNYKTYLIIVDKKLPFEIKKGLEDLDKVAKKTETE